MVKKLKQERFILITLLISSMLLHLLYGLENMKQMEELEMKYYLRTKQTEYMQNQIDILEIMLENQEQDASEPEQEQEYLGTFTVTHYCPCEECCGKSDGITFTGTQAQEGKTIAVDPEIIPLGSTVIMDGQEYIAEDIGGAIKGNRLDIFMNSHQAALQAGVVQAEVYVLEESNG
jgi:3D (Asp-Asp-Asp) domain-containing protein